MRWSALCATCPPAEPARGHPGPIGAHGLLRQISSLPKNLQVLFLPDFQFFSTSLWPVLGISFKLCLTIRFLNCASICTTLEPKSRTLSEFLQDDKDQFPQLVYFEKHLRTHVTLLNFLATILCSQVLSADESLGSHQIN